MELIEFLKIVKRNLKILIGVPIVMAVVVYILTSDSPKKYRSKAMIYTGIASGYSIESQQQAQFNYFATNNAFDNLLNIINSRKTMEETGLRLFATQVIHSRPVPQLVSKSTIKELGEIVPNDVKELIDTNSVDTTLQRLKKYKNTSKTNFVHELINLHHRHYSYEAISKVMVRRIANSDLVQLEYESDDPSVCYQTLRLLIDVFIRNYSGLRANQTDEVVKYFRRELSNTQGKLKDAEDSLLAFNMGNKIINYYEQTKHVASQIEKFELLRQQVKLDFVAAKSVKENLESKAGATHLMKLQGESIVQLRQRLFDLTQKISFYQLQSNAANSNNAEVARWKEEAEKTKQKLYESVDSLHFYENTLEGVKMDNIVYNWLNNVIAFDEARAKLKALEKRKEELDSTVVHFAPLGANLKKIERKIDVIERESLSLLHSLGLAKLKQQNLELSSNIKTLDPPVYPISALPSKRKILVVAAGFIGFMMTLVIIIAIEFFDTTLRNIPRTKKATQMSGLGMFPFTKDIEVESEAMRRSLVQIINKLVQQKEQKTGDVPFKISFVSMFRGEGKSTLIHLLEKKLNQHNFKVCTYAPNEAELSGMKGLDTDYQGVDFVFVELPSLLNRVIPLHALQQSDQLCFLIRADRGWNHAEDNLLKSIRNDFSKEISFILNAAKIEYLEEFIGQLPKKRSKVRKLMRRIVLMRFYQKFDTNA